MNYEGRIIMGDDEVIAPVEPDVEPAPAEEVPAEEPAAEEPAA